MCNLECQDLGAVKEHKFIKHQDGTLKCCTYCDYKIKGWYNLRRHIECNHPEHGEKKHFCDICGKAFFYKSMCVLHKNQKHKQKHCHICGKQCFNTGSLEDHLNAVHDLGDKIYNCTSCEFSTKSKANLKSHIAAKHNVQNHKQCPYCDYHTHMIHRIQIHLDSKHPEHDEKRISCDHCSKRFTYENSLKHHLESIKNGPKTRAKRKLKRSGILGNLQNI